MLRLTSQEILITSNHARLLRTDRLGHRATRSLASSSILVTSAIRTNCRSNPEAAAASLSVFAFVRTPRLLSVYPCAAVCVFQRPSTRPAPQFDRSTARIAPRRETTRSDAVSNLYGARRVAGDLRARCRRCSSIRARRQPGPSRSVDRHDLRHAVRLQCSRRPEHLDVPGCAADPAAGVQLRDRYVDPDKAI